MRDIFIKIKKDHTIDFENGFAGLNRENLQGNIYFEFEEFVEGQARAEIIINNQEGYILLDQTDNKYILPIKSSLLTGDSILMQLVIDQEATYFKTTDTEINNKKTYYVKVGDQYEVVEQPHKQDLGNYYEAEIPVWKSEVFFLKVGYSINATTTIPDDYPNWVETLNELITQTNDAITQAENVNITSEQLTDGVKVITTDKTGHQTETIVPQGPQGEPGVPGAVKFVIVNELPTTDIQTDTIYLVPSDDPTTQDLYLEYMYINNAWELLGQKQIVVDLTDYVKFTDYATENKGGVIKIGGTGRTMLGGNNQILPALLNYSNYSSANDYCFIGKGTLENVITGKGLVSKTDYASNSTGGVVKIDAYAITKNNNGNLMSNIYNYATYSTASDNSFISKGTLENVLTEKIGSIDSVLDAINGEVI